MDKNYYTRWRDDKSVYVIYSPMIRFLFWEIKSLIFEVVGTSYSDEQATYLINKHKEFRNVSNSR